jgi:hypothetical protein
LSARDPWEVNGAFRILQTLSAGFMALEHGHNDAQKTMGIITLALIAEGTSPRRTACPSGSSSRAPFVIGAGTFSGGKRIIKTMGMKLVKLEPIDGFAAETVAASVIQVAGRFGMPISTTHAITAAITGVGVAKRISAVRWGVTGQILTAWILTLPAAGVRGAVAYLFIDARRNLRREPWASTCCRRTTATSTTSTRRSPSSPKIARVVEEGVERRTRSTARASRRCSSWRRGRQDHLALPVAARQLVRHADRARGHPAPDDRHRRRGRPLRGLRHRARRVRRHRGPAGAGGAWRAPPASCARRWCGAVSSVRKLNPTEVRAATTEAKRLEDVVDGLHRDALRTLFRSRPEAHLLVSWKDLYDRLEETSDEAARSR